MAKQPRKDVYGKKYEFEACSGGFTVVGPGLRTTFFSREEDAEMVAAALNLSIHFEEIKRQAEAVKKELNYLTEFK